MAASSLRAPLIMIVVSVLLVGTGLYLVTSGKRIAARARQSEDADQGSIEKPTLGAVTEAIERGTRAFIRDYVQPSYDAVSNGGYVDYTNAVAETKRYGPNAYVACQLYLLTHYLMYSEELGVPADDPLLLDVGRWFVDQFDEGEGRWLWSEEGCLHPKGMIVLAKLGRRDLVDQAWAWAKRSALWLPDHAMFTMMVSGNIIQTLGDARLSLTGRHGWEHGSPMPDAENSAKFLYALLAGGHSIDEPQVAELYDGIEHFFTAKPAVLGELSVREVMGMVWYVFCHRDFGLTGSAGYTIAVETLAKGVGAGGLLRSDGLSRRFMGMRAAVIKAALSIGERSAAIDREIALALKTQSDSGAWPLSPAAKKAWWLDRKPAVGIKMGQMDGANTYLTTLALIAYRDAVLAPNRRESVATASNASPDRPPTIQAR